MISKRILGLALAAVIAPASFAGVITASVSGSVNPVTANYPTNVTNGGFTILGNASALVVGDGIDDTTTWNFDFNGPSLASFIASAPINGATLKLTVTARAAGVADDRLWIGTPTQGAIPGSDPGFIGIQNTVPTLASLVIGQTTDVQANLLSVFSPTEILDYLQNGVFGSGAGIIPFVYHDDVVVSYAELTLSTRDAVAPVPEPATFALFGVGIAAAGLYRRFRR